MMRAVLAFLFGAVAGLPSLAAAATSSAAWVTLGTSGGPSVQVERAQISNALVVGDKVYLFDVGNDVQRQLARAGIPERNIRAVFVTHHHLDHNADLGPVLVTHWLFGSGKLAVIGPKGTRTLAEGLAAANAPTALASFPTAGPAKPPIAASFVATDLDAPLRAPVVAYKDENIRVTAISVDHFQVPPSVALPEMPQAVAYRVEAGGHSFVYSGDTGPSSGLEALARGADILICEVVDLDGIAVRLGRTMPDVPAKVRAAIVDGMRVNHLTATNVGKLARASGVKRVVLTHFVPVPEQLQDPDGLARAVRAEFPGPVTLADDLDRFVP